MNWWPDILHRLELGAIASSTLGWVTSVFIVVTLVVAAGIILGIGIKKLIARAVTTKNQWDDVLLKSMQSPMILLFWIIGFSYTVEWIWATEKSSRLFDATTNVRLLGIILCAVLFLLKFLKLGEETFLHKKHEQGKPVDIASIRALNKILKASVVITAILMTLNTMGVSISGLLAFGGIGGLAVGFAAKDMLSNFFGGLMVYLDRPFVEGEWIRSPDRSIEGTVEYIGWRQTRIRAFDRHPIFVPNSIFAQIAIENRSRMECRRIMETIGVRYDDMLKVGEIAAGIKAMLKAHKEISDEGTTIVNLDKFNASSVDIMINAYTKTTDWEYFHAVKQEIMLEISRIIEEHGGEIAYPTMTLHLNDDSNNGAGTIDKPVSGL